MTRFDWDDLKFLLAVARKSTVSQAGRELTVDHATVIRRIDGLEQALGVKLFLRNSRGYNLTQNGEKLIAIAESVEREISRVANEVGNADPTISGTIRINSLEGFGNFFLSERLPRFGELNPRISVELVAIQQIVALSQRNADVSITLQPAPETRYFNEELTEYTLCLYGSSDYLERNPRIKTRDDIGAHRCIGYVSDLVFTRSLDYLQEIGYKRRAQIQFSSLHGQLAATLAGYGLCVLPHFVASQYAELIPVLPDEISLRRRYWLISHAETTDSPRVKSLRHFIKQETAAFRGWFLDEQARNGTKGHAAAGVTPGEILGGPLADL